MKTKLDVVSGVPLSQGVLDELIRLEQPDGYASHPAYSPTDTLLAIRRAGMFLRFNPYEPVLDRPIELDHTQEGDVSSKVLRDIVNASILGYASQEDTPQFQCLNPAGEGTCYGAEGNFLQATRNLHSGQRVFADVVVDREKPILLIKRIGERTCLTLCEIEIDGIPYPAGSIASYSVSQPAIKEKGSPDDMRYHRYDADDIDSLGFLRLSRFALPMEEQPLWDQYHNAPDIDPESFLNERYIPIGDIVATVEQSI